MRGWPNQECETDDILVRKARLVTCQCEADNLKGETDDILVRKARLVTCQCEAGLIRNARLTISSSGRLDW